MVFKDNPVGQAVPGDSGDHQDNPTLSVLAEQGEVALQNRKYADAKALFDTALKLTFDDANTNPYLIQRLAFATYKAKIPDVITALNDAISVLSRLDIEHTNDTETVTLAGRIEKKLYEKGDGDHHLSNAIHFYERGYFLLSNRYHGINLAFLFNKRADSSIYPSKEDKIADMIFANRVRRQVLKICERDWDEIIERKNRMALKMNTGNTSSLSDYNQADDNDQMFWIQVNKAECHFGLGEMEECKAALEKAKEIEHADWMMKAYDDQHVKLRELMQKHGHLLNLAGKWED
jgi:tetratricopeptide (TPR) repeat protein